MSAKQHPKYLSYNGTLVAYDDARVHVLSAAFKYGAIAFEGLRAYWNDDLGELFGFRFGAHMERLVETLRIARIPMAMSPATYSASLAELIRANDLRQDLHLRVQVFVEDDDAGMAAAERVSVTMAAMPMARFFAAPSLHVCVSSWTRGSDRSMPPRVKVVPNYFNSRLALMQAKTDGYDDAIILTGEGKVSEGPGYNVFIVRRGRLTTPPTTDSILEGITRDSLLRLAADLGIETEQRSIDRSELYLAEEVFFCGSAAEVSPIVSVDRHVIGSGVAGPITARLRERYLAVARGTDRTHPEWLTRIYADADALRKASPRSVVSAT